MVRRRNLQFFTIKLINNLLGPPSPNSTLRLAETRRDVIQHYVNGALADRLAREKYALTPSIKPCSMSTLKCRREKKVIVS